MSLRYYDVLEKMLQDLEKWEEDKAMNKKDVLDSTRERIIMLMRHVVTTPMIGTAYAYPGDLDLSALLLASWYHFTEAALVPSVGLSSSEKTMPVGSAL